MAMLELDGEHYALGGLGGQVEYGYLRPEWVETMTNDPAAFQCDGIEFGKTHAPFEWKRTRYSTGGAWPAPGVSLAIHFKPPAGKLEGLEVSVHYEMYDGIPLMCEWLMIHNGGAKEVRLNSFISEILAVVDDETGVETPKRWPYPNSLHAESDYAFGGGDYGSFNHTTCWVPDPQYTTQINYLRQTPDMFESRPPIGPDALIKPGGDFTTFRTFELIHDSFDRERKGLALRRMYRTIAPWVTENPIMMHLTDSRPEAVRRAVDQCAAVGFEMVILSFGSGLNMENTAPDYLARVKSLADYAHSRGVQLGAYSLFSSRHISEQDDVINPKTGKPGGAIFDNAPCLGSAWGIHYLQSLRTFIEQTGLDLLEHDGPYPGDVCASTTHPGHHGLDDSQWTQWRQSTGFYEWCRARGVYVNQPDWYFLSGGSKTGMGYREDNWSLPRERQILLARQNIYDGTWEKTPGMGWMFVPLTEYHGGGAAATIEPLAKHLPAYEAHLAQNFGAGVQACYRGPRLFDTAETEAAVRKWVNFYKRHRAILDSDIIHVRRPDGRDIDAMLHVNSQLKEKGLLVVCNPLDVAVKRELKLSLYYTGLTQTARIQQAEGKTRDYKLTRDYMVTLPVELEANSWAWFVVE